MTRRDGQHGDAQAAAPAGAEDDGVGGFDDYFGRGLRGGGDDAG
jgi:hypothetical protein